MARLLLDATELEYQPCKVTRNCALPFATTFLPRNKIGKLNTSPYFHEIERGANFKAG